MKQDQYELEVPPGSPRQLAIGWLFLALGALILGGLLTILIVLSRTPGVQSIIPWTDFFHTAIIVHVDLTVLVWFLAFAGIFWSLNGNERGAGLGWLALGLCVLGTIIFTAAPFLGAGDPLMNNYIPILLDNKFLIGLGMVGLGFSVSIVRGLISLRGWGNAQSGAGVLQFGIVTGLISALASVLALMATYIMMPQLDQPHAYYELLFWGGGHTLQFTHTQLMVVAWLVMATAAGVSIKLSPRAVWIIIALGFAPVLAVPVLYAMYSVDSAEHLVMFTKLMQYGGGISALPIGLMLVVGWAATGFGLRTPERSAMICSILLFGFGGVIGYLISGINVTIPAHYHGSIVAVTIAFMGFAYYLLPRFGFEIRTPKLATWQPAIYAGGQCLHVLGLAWAGGYGIQRKTAGAAQGLHNIQEIAAMGIMGVGGLISVIGGLLFLVVAIKAIWPVLRK